MRKTGIVLALGLFGCQSILGIEDTFVDEAGFPDLRIESITRQDPSFIVRYCNDGGDSDPGRTIRLELINNTGDADTAVDGLDVPVQGDCLDSAVACTELVPDCRAAAQLDAIIDAGDELAEAREDNNEGSVFFAFALRAFVTSQERAAPDLRSAFEADELCQQDADSAGLGGIWQAWLSDSVFDPRFRTRTNRALLERTDGVALVQRSEDLMLGQPLLNPLDRDENAQSVPVGSCVWTGTDDFGRGVGSNCSNWSATTDTTATGEVGRIDLGWTAAQFDASCDQPCRMYCIEQLVVPPQPPVAELAITRIQRNQFDYEVEMCNSGETVGVNDRSFVVVYNSQTGQFREQVFNVPASGECVLLFAGCSELGDFDCERAVDIVAVADPLNQIVEGNERDNTSGLSLGALSIRLFVSSISERGDLIGSALAGDAICQSLADSVGFGGLWRAWLSDSTTSPAVRFVQHDLPYKLRNGVIVADNYADLIDGTLLSPIDTDEFFGVVSACVWTGTDTAGNSLGDDCVDWTDPTGDVESGVSGFTNALDSTWTQVDNECAASCRFYCFEQ